MNIYDQFHLPTETDERRKALHASVKQWLEHEDQDLTIKEICDQLRSTEDVVENRPPCVTTKEGILETNALYKVAFTFKDEINNTLGLN
jgi:23S rRNA maturation mini-RNase III